MNDRTENPGRWGDHAPRGTDHLLLLAKKAGLAHGPLKRVLARAWRARHPGTPVDITYQGVRFRLHPWDNVTDAKILFGSRNRDRIELEALRERVADGGIFIDIGANIGYYSLFAAAFGAARIVAVEPNPLALERLVFNISANGYGERIKPLPVALGASTGQATLFIPEQGDMGGGRISDHELDGRQVTVPVRPLATVLEELGIMRIDALKIDVEGMEDTVLFPFFDTAPRSLWPSMIIIEHTSGTDWKRDILSWLLAHGYTVKARTRSNMVLQLDAGDTAP
ncbi:MAG: FkbM family methyltransferase [Gammaproteobacteria bacterium]